MSFVYFIKKKSVFQQQIWLAARFDNQDLSQLLSSLHYHSNLF